MVDIKILGLDAVSEHLRTASTLYEQAPDEIAHHVGALWLTAMRDEAPRRSGRMADNLGMIVELSGTRSSVHYFGLDYTNFVIQGTRPHPIFPRVRRHLAFFIDGRRVVMRHVRHPGTRANDFPGRAFRDIRGRITEYLHYVGARIVGLK